MVIASYEQVRLLKKQEEAREIIQWEKEVTERKAALNLMRQELVGAAGCG